RFSMLSVSSTHQSADWLNGNDSLDISFLHQIENDNRQIIIHAERNRGRIHNFKLAVQDFDIAQLYELPSALILDWVGVVYAIDFGRFQNNFRTDFHGTQTR